MDGSWTWQAPVVSGAVTVEDLPDPAAVTVTNTPQRVYAPLRVTKVFNGPAAALAPGAEVTGAWTCDFGGVLLDAGRWRLPASGGSDLIAAADGTRIGDNGPIRLPAGAVCTVVEDTPADDALADGSYAWEDPVSDPVTGEVTLVASADNNVTITNDTHRVYGAFRVVKDIGLADNLQRPGGVFKGTWSCTYGSDAPVTGLWQVTGEGTDLFSGILVGSECTIEETPPAESPSLDPSYVWDPATIAPASVMVVGDQPALLTVTNPTHRVLTGLGITKVLAGDTAGEPAGHRYAVSYRCVDASGGVHTDSRSLGAGETWTTDRVIPMGSQCTVTEGALPDVSPKYAWLPVAFTVTGPVEPGATVAQETGFTLFNPQEEGNPLAHVVVTNTLKQQLPGEGPVWTLEKSSDPPSGSTVAPDTSITYTLTVTNRSTTTSLPAGTVITDDLSDVLNHASFVGIRDGHAGDAVLRGTKLVWTLPEVSPGTVRKLHYVVHIDPLATGVTVRNSVTALADVAPSSTDCRQSGTTRAAPAATNASRCATSTTHHTSPAGLGPAGGEQPGPGAGPALPDTGAPPFLGWAALLGALLVVAGTGLLLLRRRTSRH